MPESGPLPESLTAKTVAVIVVPVVSPLAVTAVKTTEVGTGGPPPESVSEIAVPLM